MRATYLLFFLALSLYSQELKIKADSFAADEKSGVSIFTGSVNILRSNDELNATEVTVYTDSNHKPLKFVAVGNVSFHIETKSGSVYNGVSQKAIYIPEKKEYQFFKNVHLKQLDENKEIIGEEVVLKATEGKAHAKGKKDGPVIMIFNVENQEEEGQ
ncbi:MAG: lipopolysaccharide transport periplasmic protein LptA [Sulfurimonas sp.]|nr:lipopolysaccharide transport periplasmic protein LptA [Sulfurimonas sp.]MBU3939231.1 lipopolysaccharide transport periplasmic protein LptA [bacterium]MBU4025282.1 lipopolysaccharide transport periplasmic protein LptA [bacterium]MBU4059760.1 lipopolysaccharide transport periplasmic protein LptA [bacterium]